MYEIDVKKLINAIKARPALYKKNDELHQCTRKQKVKMWREVCSEVYADWNQLSEMRKIERVLELQRRWKSTRNCFTREISLQKKEKIKIESDQPVKKRKRYEYFKQLLFLREEYDGDDGNDDNDDERDTDSSPDPFDCSYQDGEMSYDPGESSSDVKNSTMGNVQDPVAQYTEMPVVYERNNLEPGILDVLKHSKREEEDEDRQFILSLVPTLRKMNDKQKIKARIEILKVLQNIAFQDE